MGRYIRTRARPMVAVLVVAVACWCATGACASMPPARGTHATAAPHNTTSASTPVNVLFLVVDNMRPALGAYNVTEAITPRMDALAAQGTLLARAYCNFAWCAPSRNSFLSGRTPDTTQAWNFLNSFRQAPGAQDWVTLPGYFKRAGYYATSLGKVFHPDLPPNFDYPASWTDQPIMPVKPVCGNQSMTCAYKDGSPVFDADTRTADLAIQRLKAWAATTTNADGSSNASAKRPFFAAVGFQGPRLPWSYPTDAAARYPPASTMPVALHRSAPARKEGERLEWFRPTEVDMYSDVRNLTHATPMPVPQQQLVRRAYLSAITHVDDQVGRVLDTVRDLGVDDSTVVVLLADHGQNLGESGMWSMMNNLETSLRVPMMIRLPPASAATAASTNAAAVRSAGAGLVGRQRNAAGTVPVYWHPVDLLDLYPTLASLAGLPPPDPSWNLPGYDISAGLFTGKAVKPVNAAFGQITRCANCTLAYPSPPSADGGQCRWDASEDAAHWTVPCALAPRTRFDWMGMTIRTPDWRYAVWCGWLGSKLVADWGNCTLPELYDHRNDTALYDVNHFEYANLAGEPAYAGVEASLRAALQEAFQPSTT